MPRVASALSAAVAKASEPTKNDKVSRSLFKSLLKIAKNFDEHPAARALIYRKMTINAMNNPVQTYYTELLDRILGPNRQLYQPSGTVTSFVELVRLESRKPYSVNHQFSASTKVDTGFAALRNLSSIWNNYSSFDDEDDESEDFEDDDFNAAVNGLEAEVTLASTLCAGMLLVAHPMLQGPLHRSVVLMLEHNTRGSYGLVINSGTDRSLHEAVKNLPEDILASFGDNHVAFGGMVRRLAYIHDVQAVGGLPIPMCKRPMYAGGQIDKAIAFLNNSNNSSENKSSSSSSSNISNTNSSSDSLATKRRRFRMFAGCCLWDRGELQRDVDSGYWIPVLSEPDTVLARALPNTRSSTAASSSSSLSPPSYSHGHSNFSDNAVLDHNPSHDNSNESSGGISHEGSNDNDNDVNDGHDVWHLLLRGLGDPFTAMAQLPQWINASSVDPSDWK